MAQFCARFLNPLSWSVPSHPQGVVPVTDGGVRYTPAACRGAAMAGDKTVHTCHIGLAMAEERGIRHNILTTDAHY